MWDQLNARRDLRGGDFLPWICFGARVTDYNVDPSTETPIPFEIDGVTDYQGMWDPATPTRITIIRDDLYLVAATYTITESTGGIEFAVTARLNGTDVGIRETHIHPSVTTEIKSLVTAASVLDLVVGDYLEVYAFHNDVATRPIVAGSDTHWLMVQRVG